MIKFALALLAIRLLISLGERLVPWLLQQAIMARMEMARRPNYTFDGECREIHDLPHIEARSENELLP